MTLRWAWPWRWGAGVAGALVCILVAGVVGAVPDSEAAVAEEPVRVLLVGDSVTQGSAGDWTWRYRLWKHLELTAGGPVDLVGPRDDLWDDLADQLGNHDYIDPAFDQDHASRWGMTFAFADNRIEDLVRDYHPDVVVGMLGFNDLVIGRSPGDIEQDVRSFVQGARSVDATVDVVLAETVQTWAPGVPELNVRTAVVAEQLDDPSARVVVADTDAGFGRDEHTYDTSHPDAQGEVLIAAAVGDALAALGVGEPVTRPLPIVPRGPRIPVVLGGARDGATAALRWVPSPGAWSAQVQQRDLTRGSRWRVVADRVRGSSWRSSALKPGHRYEYRVLPRKGSRLAEDDVASAGVAVRIPRLPARPRGLRVGRRPGRVVLTWRATPRAETYIVRLRRPGRSWVTVASHQRRPRLAVRRLRAGGHYEVKVAARGSVGVGPWSGRVRFIAP